MITKTEIIKWFKKIICFINLKQKEINMAFQGKISSGRFLMTITAAICFLLLTKTFCNVLILKINEIEINDLLPCVSSMLIILSNIFTFYFTKRATNSYDVENGNRTNQS